MAKQYEVGYGKPPKEHQWKPGQSGNPSGRKKRIRDAFDTKAFRDYVAEELLEYVSPMVDGKKQEMRLAKAIAKAIVRDLMKGKPKEKILILRELRSQGILQRFDTLIREAKFEAATESSISEEERLMLEALNEALDLDDGDS